jgi:hypothetical protein
MFSTSMAVLTSREALLQVQQGTPEPAAAVVRFDVVGRRAHLHIVAIDLTELLLVARHPHKEIGLRLLLPPSAGASRAQGASAFKLLALYHAGDAEAMGRTQSKP